MPTLETVARTAGVSGIVALADGGTLRIRSGSTTRVDIPLEATAFDVADGVATARGNDGSNPVGTGNPLSGESDTVGTWDNYQVLSSEAAVLWSGSSSELTLSIVGDTVNVNSWSFTIPAS